jgi:hypothetical protein
VFLASLGPAGEAVTAWRLFNDLHKTAASSVGAAIGASIMHVYWVGT